MTLPLTITLNMLIKADDISNFGTILSVWAHPDDETRCVGGIMAVAAQNGQRVSCITATRGEAGRSADENKWPHANLGQIRSHELSDALKIIGISEHYWLNYNDGCLADCDPKKAAHDIAELINKVNPDTIFCFGPDGFTGHPDHCTIYSWTHAAIQIAKSNADFYRVVEPKEKHNSKITRESDKEFHLYMSPTDADTESCEDADIYFVLPEEIMKKKLAAIKQHQSQYSHMFASPVGMQYFTENDGSECFMKVKI